MCSIMLIMRQPQRSIRPCRSLYLDWKSGEITKEEYRRLKGKIAEQIQQLEANISYLKEEMQVMADGIGTDDPYLTAFLKYARRSCPVPAGRHAARKRWNTL